MQPHLVEKDFYLTRLLWALGEKFGDRLLLKGGTLLSKVDLGFFRMSEDADLVMPGAPSHVRGSNMRSLNVVRDALDELEELVGVKRRFPSGEDSEKGAHRRWDLDYESEFGVQSIQLEVSLRPVLREPRRVILKQLLNDPLAGSYNEAFCWALDASEARAGRSERRSRERRSGTSMIWIASQMPASIFHRRSSCHSWTRSCRNSTRRSSRIRSSHSDWIRCVAADST